MYFEYVSTHRSEPWRIAQQATLFAAWLALVLGWLGWPSHAQAWTRSVVTSAGAELEVLSSSELHVVLRIGLSVQGGWLSRFDVAGLEPDLQLDPSAAAWLVSRTDGRAYTPTVSTSAPGQLTVSFANRRDAPWRGDYELGLVYTARSPILNADRSVPQRLGVAWQMPAWDRGLEDVRVRVSGPGAPAARRDPALDHVVRVLVVHDAGREGLEFRRLQLPRATPWTVAFELAAGGLPPSIDVPRETADVTAPALWPRHSLPLWLALLLCALALAKHVAVQRAAARRNAEAVPLVPMPTRLRHAAVLALCAAGGLLAGRQPDAALWLWGAAVLCALSRGVRPLPARKAAGPWPGPGAVSLRPGTTRWQAVAELLVGRAWLDLTTPVGAVLATSALGLGGALCMLPHGTTLPLLVTLLALPLFLTGTRLHLPPSAAARLHGLARLAQALRLAHEPHGRDPRERARAELVTDRARQDVRLRIEPVSSAGELLELAIVLHDVAWLGRVRSVAALRVRAPLGSPAVARLRLALPGAQCAESDHGIEWLQPTGTPDADLKNLLGWLDARSPRERVAA